MTDSYVPDAGCPGKWPRPLRLALDSIVTALMNAYRSWFNCIRVHQGIGGQTPEQASFGLMNDPEALDGWSGTGLPAAKIVRARDPQPGILVSRRTFEDDPHLPVVNIEVEWAEAA